MKTWIITGCLCAGLTAVPGRSAWAQAMPIANQGNLIGAPARIPTQMIPQVPAAPRLAPGSVGRPGMPVPAPAPAPALAPAQGRVWTDARGQRWLTSDRRVQVFDPRAGRYVVRVVQDHRLLGAPGVNGGIVPPHYPTNPGSGPASVVISASGNSIGQGPGFPPQGGGPLQAPSAAYSGNAIGQNPNRPATPTNPPTYSIPVANGGNSIGNPGTPSTLPPPPDAGEPVASFAANLGVYYVPLAYNNGTFGLKLTNAPVANSATATLGLQAGDVIFRLDGQPFRVAGDPFNHVGRTSIDYLDSDANVLRAGTVMLTPQAP